MCSLNAGKCRPHSGHRYVAGFLLAAGRTAYQAAWRKSSTQLV